MLDANKASVLPFSASGQAIIGQAGNADRSARVVEIAEKLAITKTMTEDSSVADVIRQAILEARSEMRAQMFNCSSEELLDYIWRHDQDCQIISGHYFKDEAVIHVGNFAQGFCTRVTTTPRTEFKKKYFAAIGTGADLAVYLLKQHAKPDMDFGTAFAIAVYVLEEVKSHDAFCGGETHFVFLDKKSNVATRLDSNAITEISAAICKAGDSARVETNEKLTTALDEVTQKWSVNIENLIS
jgi:hypothetical protein